MPAFAGMTEEFARQHLSNLPAVRRRSRTNFVKTGLSSLDSHGFSA